MNAFIVIGLVSGGAIIALDRLIDSLPDLLCIVLYSAAIILDIIGMVIRRNTSSHKFPKIVTVCLDLSIFCMI